MNIHNKETTFNLLKKIVPHIGKRNLFSIIVLQFLSFLSSLVEAVSVGAIIPFMALIADPEKVYNSIYLKKYIIYFSLNKSQLIFSITTLFISLVLLSALLKWIFIYLNTKISNSIGSLLAYNLFKRTLYQPYITHISRNSSEIISGVTRANDLVISIILPFFLLFNSIFTIVLLSSVLLYLNPYIIISTFFCIAIFYLIVMKIVKRKLLLESQIMYSRKPLLYKILQEGLGGIRDILIDGSQSFFSDLYYKNETQFKKSQIKVTLINNTPNIAIQSFGICLIAFLAGYMATKQNMSSTLPFLGALAFGYLRISPAIQQIFTSWTSLKSGHVSLKYVVDFLNINLPEYAIKPLPSALTFEDSIALNNITFQYSNNNPFIFNNLNLNIKKGSRVGFIGSTGSGKSTLIDIIISLIEPTSGYIKVDDIIIDKKNFRSWQMNIAHVPQTIYLSDNTILENIAFGIPKDKIDFDRAVDAAKKAQIYDTILLWENKFETQIGERGVRLSGGQRQRIGIARSLYKKAKVIVFDEATSALDGETEGDVMNSIDLLGSELTILMVAHRISTLKNCDYIYELKNGQLILHKNFNELLITNNIK